MHIMSASGRDPTGPTVLGVLFFEESFILKAPSRLLQVIVDFVVHEEFEDLQVKSGNCICGCEEHRVCCYFASLASRGLFCLEKFLLEYFLFAGFAFVDLEFFSVFVPSEEQDIVLEKLPFDSFRIWESVVRYLLSLACVLPIVLVCCWLFWGIVSLGCFLVWQSYLVVLVVVVLCGCLRSPRPLVTST